MTGPRNRETLRLLDLFCGAGGAAMGYHRAGFDVVGVDIRPQPRYPFQFIQEDAMRVLRTWFHLDEFAAIHASPPCQEYSKALRHLSSPQPRLITFVTRLLTKSGLPWIIENVEGAPLPRQDTLDGRYGIELCGSMFGLRVRRHRLFECSFPVVLDRGCDHRQLALNPYNAKARERDGITRDATKHHATAMQVDWMRGAEIGEAIPPAYTEFIGHQLMQHIRQGAVV